MADSRPYLMRSVSSKILCVLVVLQVSAPLLRAQEDRFSVLDKRIKDLAAIVPGLNQKAELSVTDITLKEFLQALAATHNLNLNIDPSHIQKVNNRFSDETKGNILVYLARQNSQDYTFIGSIITITPYRNP